MGKHSAVDAVIAVALRGVATYGLVAGSMLALELVGSAVSLGRRAIVVISAAMTRLDCLNKD